MWCLLCRCLAVLYAATRLPTVNAHLWNIEYTASNNIFVNVAQKILAEDEAVTISKPCTVTPEDFDVRTSRDRFFVVSCLSTVPKVQVFLRGDFVFNKEGAPIPSDGYVIPLTHASEPTLLSAYSCDNDIYGDVTNLKNCIPFSVSVYRRSGQLAHLSAIGVTSNRLAALRPNFNAFHFYYNASVEINQPLAISASVMENMAKVGIEFEGSPGVDSGLTPGMTCGHGTQSNEVWKLPGFKAVGEYRYKLCAFAPFSHHVREYHIKVVVTPLYSSKLTTIDVGRFTLVPPFEEHVQSYHVTIPGNVMTVPVSAVSKDKQASIFIAYDGHEERAGHDEEDEGEVLRGSASASVAMHDNSELKVGEPPQWTMPVTFHVRSADGSHTMSYVVTIKQTVDTFCHLQNLTVGTSACELVPAFSPNVTEYYCEWWWEDAHGKEVTWGEVVPYMDKARCKDCWLLAPNDKTEPGHFLNIHWESVQRDKWPWGKAWRREFKYGDHHIIPFQVVSADKFTHTTYHVHLFRNAPWWMQTWLTRFVSHAASTLSIVMAVSSAANVMALAKQIQFMTLTTEIDGVPKVYEDFANGLRTFNLDAFSWIPWERFGLPTADQIKDYKKNMKKYVEHELGIDHATLLLQYCEALRNNYQNGDMVYPNAILDLIPENAATLLKQLKKRKAREEAEAKKKAAAAAAADAGAATGAKVTDSSDTKDSDSTDVEAASERRLLDRGMAAIISWVSQWIYTPSSSDDDMSVHDAKVSLRGAGFSVVSSSSVLLERPLPQNYSRNSSFAILDKSFLSGVVPSMHALSTDKQARRLQGMEDLVDDDDEEEEELSEEEKFAKKIGLDRRRL